MTTIFVTHDQDEALSLSDRVAVMSAGVDPPARHARGGLQRAGRRVRRRLRRHDQPARRHERDRSRRPRRGGRRRRAGPAAGRHAGAGPAPADVGIIGFRPESVIVHESCAAGHHDGAVNTFDAPSPRRRLPRRPLPLPDRRRRHAGHGADDAHRVARRPVDGRDPTARAFAPTPTGSPPMADAKILVPAGMLGAGFTAERVRPRHRPRCRRHRHRRRVDRLGPGLPRSGDAEDAGRGDRRRPAADDDEGRCRRASR